MIDTTSLLIAIGAATLGGCAVFLACRWWYQRSLAALQGKLQRMDQARAASSERSKQARQQIAQLQAMIAELQSARAAARTERRDAVTAAPAPVAAPSVPDAGDDDLPYEPFAQTQVLR